MFDVGAAVEELRRTGEHLPAARLHLLTGGVISSRVPGADLIVIKPPGAPIDRTLADSVVVTDLSGKVLDGVFAPSSGGDAHAVVYRELPAVRSIVNTRSTLSLAWAARGEPIPHLPTVTDEFGGPIPVGPVVSSRGDVLGRGIVDTVRTTGARAVQMPGHGPFTIGQTASEAIRVALLLEQLTRKLHIARHLGTAEPLDPHDTDWLTTRDRRTDAGS
ncbi:class II aldolase/adducin family protein [Kribbella kalugense]|uniref:L-ribulose-5-phosphate 4-epimerase n=1 Tax=Kribbella kalugense TaxID=2512221 RepID=A0A4R8A4D0_9ACTN|nr:class II aldolase/adducin family protein [Kribbella kalugense]TDW24338.1 L-ribulose-5-phosphate 4-epimerase [Kribbella kalugense]